MRGGGRDRPERDGTDRSAGTPAGTHPTRRLAGDGVPGEGGFALLVALLALIGVTVLATGGFLATRSESRIVENHEGAVRAFYVANAGLQQYLGAHRGVPEGTETLSLPSGSATVAVTALGRPDTARKVFLLTSTGTHVSADGGGSVRTVGTLAVLDLGTVSVPGAFASGVALHKNGGSGEISGYDLATPTDCPDGGQPAKAGVVLPPGGYVQIGGDSVPEGDPPILEQDPLVTLESTGIDWEGIVNGTAIDPDYRIPPDSWPDFSTLPSDAYPVIYADTAILEVGPGHSGRGTLMVRGALTMNGSFHWDGLLFVGGDITSDGNQIIHGGTVTGLNLLLGETVSVNDLGNGTKTFRFHSCNVLAAAAELASLAVKPGSWFERM